MKAALSTREVAMLTASNRERPQWDRTGLGVELRGAGDWMIARRLVGRELGWIEGGRPQGSELPGLFFANEDGIAIVAEPEPEEEDWG